MRKYLFVLACALTIVGCRQKQGQTAGDAAMADSVQTEETIDGKSFTPAEIGSAWTSKDIAVPNGGQQPGIIALLDAFSRVWPTDVASFVMGLAQDPKFEFFANRDTGGGVSVDRKNGYVNAMPGDAPGDVLKAAVWMRSNGHQLLGLHIFTPQGGIMPEGSALCFYDYDPTTETMTPEKDNAVLRFKPSKDHFAQYEFPNLGRDMLVGDTDKSYDATWHVFTWDGMSFKEEISYTDDDLRKAVVGLWMNVDKKFPFTFRISADDEGWPVITDCGIYGSTEYDAHLSCYEGRVVVAEQSPKGDDEEDEEDERFEPSLVCHFRLTKDGRLTGGYYMKQPGGKEYNGIMTLEKQSALNDYAE